MIDLAKARELLAASVATQGEDFVYNTTDGARGTCFNVPFTEDLRDEFGQQFARPPAQDSPQRKTGCIVGTAMTIAGLTHKKGYPAGGVSTAYGQHLSVEAVEYLQIAQRSQDAGHSWGAALAEAEAWAVKEIAAWAEQVAA